ncbi:MAG: GntR family transcriptional regulator, partial [Calditrichaeota bacterium]|nr:GntR family transcriptional regulator [Calditrichota bacterium]
MAEIGKINHLTVIRELEFGVYFDGGELGKILLPRRQVDRHYENGEVVEVFIYRDSDDRLLATTRRPLAEVGEFAWLRAAAVTE